MILLASSWNAMRGSLSDVVLPIRGTLIALVFGALLVVSLAAPANTWWSRLLCGRVLCFLGTRSYGLYVFHGIVAYGMGEHPAAVKALSARIGGGPAMVVAAVLGAGVSILIAAVSYEVFEKHFLRLKSRLAPSVRKAPAVVALDTQLAD